MSRIRLLDAPYKHYILKLKNDFISNFLRNRKAVNAISAIILLSLSGCMASLETKNSSSAYQSQIPSWVKKPLGDNPIIIYGIGEGSDLESAKQSALKDIAGKLETYIHSETENRDYLFNGSTDSHFKQKVNTEIKRMKLSNYEVLQSTQSGERIYMQVALSRALFVSEKITELEELDQQIEALLHHVGQKNRLVQIQRYQQALTLANQAKALIALIQAADNDQDKRGYLTKYRDYAQQKQRLLEQSKIYLVPNVALEPVVHHIKGLLQKQGLQLGSRTDADGILEVAGSIQEAEIFSNKSVKIDMSISVSTSEGQSLSRADYTLTGSSVSNYETSRSQALSKLSEQLDSREKLYKLFGDSEN